MQKTNSIVIYPIVCPKGHTFYPKVLPNGTIKKYEKCPIANCRSLIDRIKVKVNINYRTQFLIHGQKKTKIEKHPYCKICKIHLWDNNVFKKHNKRLHDN